MSKQPFEAPFSEIENDPGPYVWAVFSSLASEFLVMPKGRGFVEYPVFEEGYERLKRATGGFRKMSVETVLPVALEVPISTVVLRSMMGFTPPEWAYTTAQRTGMDLPQGFARSFDRTARLAPLTPLKRLPVAVERITALVNVACQLLNEGPAPVGGDKLHRLNKADTAQGPESLKALASLGAPYAMLLYERFLGRPFAGHRDSVSELVGDDLESAIEEVLNHAGVTYRKTKRAERIVGFDQTPDFIIPSEFNPQVVIEAKVTEDDGTARDKVTRIQHLSEISQKDRPPGQTQFELVACIAGRGFAVRREDMKKLLLATRGKVFTLSTLARLVDCTRLREFRTK